MGLKPAPKRRWIAAMAMACALAPAAAQEFDVGDWGLDPAVLAASGQDLLRRTPDHDVDVFFQAVHAAAQVPAQSQALCRLFAPEADRSLPALQSALDSFEPASRGRLADALAGMLVAGLQGEAQSHDPALGRQALKSAGVTAALLNDGFLAGLQGDTRQAAGREAQCRSVRWLLDAASQRPRAERAALTRLLLDEGLQRLPASY